MSCLSKPGLVGGNVVHRGELIAHEGWLIITMHSCGERRGHRMDLTKFRRQQIEAASRRCAPFIRLFSPNDGGGEGNITSQVAGAWEASRS